MIDVDDAIPRAQAVLLLTANLARSDRDGAKPLSSAEWGRFAHWLHEQKIQPEDLLQKPPQQILEGWSDRTITVDRLCRLLDRGLALGLAMDKWTRAGLWVMTRSDPNYPQRLKNRLGTRSPALLFGCGPRKLLGQRAAAVVGSRDASAEDLSFASALGGIAAEQGWSIVSGGARGVDQAAMLGALEREGTAIGVLSDSLLRSSASGSYRKWLMAKSLVLVSPFDPEVGFVVGNAMERNKHIYCLSDAAIVVATRRGNGGTWNGAIENLKHAWVPLWIKTHTEDASGSAELVRRGARWLPDAGISIDALAVAADPSHGAKPAQGELVMDQPAAEYAAPRAHEPASPDESLARPPEAISSLTFYELFLARLEKATSARPMSAKQLENEFGELTKTQRDKWLKQAIEDGKLHKQSKPVRYQWQTQTALFEAPPKTKRRRAKR